MFTPPTTSHENTSRTIALDTAPAAAYASGLRPVDADDVGLLELLHTLDPALPGATAATVDTVLAANAGVTGLYRDGAGTLVVRHEPGQQDTVTLLWPVQQPLTGPGAATVVHAAGRAAFVEASGVDGLVPLPLAHISPGTVFQWGYSGSGPHLLYQALVYAVDGSTASATHGSFVDHPDSFYGWLTRQDPGGFSISWPELLDRVAADWPLREAFASSH